MILNHPIAALPLEFWTIQPQVLIFHFTWSYACICSSW